MLLLRVVNGSGAVIVVKVSVLNILRYHICIYESGVRTAPVMPASAFCSKMLLPAFGFLTNGPEMIVLLRNNQHLPDYYGVYWSLRNTEFSSHILPVDVFIRWYICVT